jgi:CHAD domain-containing protein
MKNAAQDSEPTLGQAFGALAAKECKALQRALAAKTQRQEHIHRARKSCRRLRGLLAFVKPQANEKVARMDKVLRELLHDFSAIRDAHVARHTARLLAAAHEARLTPALLSALRQHSQRLLQEALENDPDWRRRRGKVERLSARVEKLPWHAVRSSQVKILIGKSAKRVDKAHRTADDERAPDAFHRWRRRARKLRYALQLTGNARSIADMKKTRTKRYVKRAKKIKLQTDRLGWRQDFQVFLQTLDQLAKTTADAAALSQTLRRKSPDLSSQPAAIPPDANAAHTYIAPDPKHGRHTATRVMP